MFAITGPSSRGSLTLNISRALETRTRFGDRFFDRVPVLPRHRRRPGPSAAPSVPAARESAARPLACRILARADGTGGACEERPVPFAVVRSSLHSTSNTPRLPSFFAIAIHPVRSIVGWKCTARVDSSVLFLGRRSRHFWMAFLAILHHSR